MVFLCILLLEQQPKHFHGGLLAVQIARFPKENGSRARTVVITQGKDPTVIAFNGKVRGACRGECSLSGCITCFHASQHSDLRCQRWLASPQVPGAPH